MVKNARLGHRGGRAGVALEAAHGEAHRVAFVGHQLLKRVDHGHRRLESIPAHPERGGSRMRLSAAHLNAEPVDALDPRHGADGQAFVLQPRPLLDMRLDVGREGMAEGAMRQPWRGREGLGERFF